LTYSQQSGKHKTNLPQSLPNACCVANLQFMTFELLTGRFKTQKTCCIPITKDSQLILVRDTNCVWCDSHAVPQLRDVMARGTHSDSSALQVRKIPNVEFTVNSVAVSGWPLALMNSAPPLSAATEHCPANMATTCQILNEGCEGGHPTLVQADRCYCLRLFCLSALFNNAVSY